MKWNNRRAILGDTRNVIKFALFPKRVGKGTIVWLERYISIQQYQDVKKYEGSGMACCEYTVNEWVETGTSIWTGNRHIICLNR